MIPIYFFPTTKHGYKNVRLSREPSREIIYTLFDKPQQNEDAMITVFLWLTLVSFLCLFPTTKHEYENVRLSRDPSEEIIYDAFFNNLHQKL